MILLISLTAICTIGYVFLLRFYLAHWKPELFSPTTITNIPFCSVVIAARNEELQIGKCLQCVLSQSYPSDRFEVIVVDDRSEDHTADRVMHFPGVKLLQTSLDAQGKKHALTKGIAAATGEIIVTTDADCVTQSGWLMAMASSFSETTQMVSGPVLIHEAKNAIERFQALDVAGLAIITASGIQSGLHHLANGANMAFRKSAFEIVGGFHSNANFASGDDIFLAQSIARKFPESIRYAWHSDAVVLTEPCRSIRALLRQRIRWATKNKSLQQRSIFWIWVFIWSTFVLNFVNCLLALSYSPALSIFPLAMIATIMFAEYLFLRRVTKYYAKDELMRGFVLSFLMHYAYKLTIGIAGALTKRYRWKDRQVS